jgi:hypothetical protein
MGPHATDRSVCTRTAIALPWAIALLFIEGFAPPLRGVVPLPSIRPIQAIGASAGGVEPQKELHEEFVASHSLGGGILIGLLILQVAGALRPPYPDAPPAPACSPQTRQCPPSPAAR